jgi:hypothetical protein
MKYEYNIIKCQPERLEEKLNEEGKKGWKFRQLSMEQQIVKSSIQSFGVPENRVINVLVIIFEKCQE